MIKFPVPTGTDYIIRPRRKGETANLVYTTRPFSPGELRRIGNNATEEACRRYGYAAVEKCAVKEGNHVAELKDSERQRIHVLDGRTGSGWLHFPDTSPAVLSWVHAGDLPDRTIYGLAQLQDAHTESLTHGNGRLPFALWCPGTHAAIDSAALGMFPLWRPSGAGMPDMETIVKALRFAKAVMVPFPTYGTNEWRDALEGLRNEDTSGCLVITHYGKEEGGAR